MILKEMPNGIEYFSAVAVMCFTKKGDLILLKKRDDHPVYAGLWGVPAGKVEKGEDVLETAIREPWEETKNHVCWQNLIFLRSDPTVHYKPNGEPFYFICHSFYLNRPLGMVTLNRKEHTKCKPLPLKKVLAMNSDLFIPDAYDNFRDFYKKYYN